MQKVENERHQFIGKLAIALKSAEIQITFDSLKSIMKDRGYDGYSETENVGFAKVVRAAHDAFKESGDCFTRAAIAETFTDKDGNFAYDPEK